MFGDFYHIISREATPDGFEARLRLNAGHPVYAAHFPGRPVTPGVCLLQMAVELTALHYGTELGMEQASNIKFLQVVDPVRTPEITLAVKCSRWEGVVNASVRIADGTIDYAKISMSCHEKTAVGVPTGGRLRAMKAVLVVPTYNNEKSLAAVLDELLATGGGVIAVDDGSTDSTAEILAGYVPRLAAVVSYSPNRGKGHALKAGFARAREMGYDYAVTFDSDGQHKAAALAPLLDAAEAAPGALVVGSRVLGQENMPQGNTFANKFSNFWFNLQTLRRIPDTQSGLRCYPLRRTPRPLTDRYEAELEMLVRAAWRGVEIVPVPVEVYYPPLEERVSHFRPGRDFARISLLNTVLTLSAAVYGYPSMLVRKMFKKSSK